MEDYHNNKFGIALKVNVDKEVEKQVVFYCLKNQVLYEQFFLNEVLISEKYNAHNFGVSLTDFKISKSQKENGIKSENTGNKSNTDFKEEMKINKFIKGNIFESETNSYLRRKLFQEEGKVELPNVFNTINKSVGNNFFFNELDCVFKVNNSIKFDENMVRINCKYEKVNLRIAKIIIEISLK